MLESSNDVFDVPSFEAKEPTVVVKVVKTRAGKSRNVFVGLGRVKQTQNGQVIAGFNGIFPSRNSGDTENLILILEDLVFNQGRNEGVEDILGQKITWTVR